MSKNKTDVPHATAVDATSQSGPQVPGEAVDQGEEVAAAGGRPDAEDGVRRGQGRQGQGEDHAGERQQGQGQGRRESEGQDRGRGRNGGGRERQEQGGNSIGLLPEQWPQNWPKNGLKCHFKRIHT